MLNTLARYWIVSRSIFTTWFWSLIAMSVIIPGLRSRQRSNYFVRTWSASLLRIIDLDYQVFNPHNVKFEPGKHYIVMCNHSSLYDIPLSVMAIDGSVRMLAKKELRHIPIFGYAMAKNEFLFIDRKNRNQAIKDLKLAAEKMRSGIILWIAPEGTRSRDGRLLPFKKGGFMLAIETGATIVPLGIRGAIDIVEPRTFKVKRGQHAEMHIGQPIDASAYTLEQRDALMEKVRAAISEVAAVGRLPGFHR